MGFCSKLVGEVGPGGLQSRPDKSCNFKDIKFCVICQGGTGSTDFIENEKKVFKTKKQIGKHDSKWKTTMIS